MAGRRGNLEPRRKEDAEKVAKAAELRWETTKTPRWMAGDSNLTFIPCRYRTGVSPCG